MKKVICFIVIAIFMFVLSGANAENLCRYTEFDYKEDKVEVHFSDCSGTPLKKAIRIGYEMNFFSEAFGLDLNKCDGINSPTGHTSSCNFSLEEFKKLWFMNNDESLTIVYAPVSGIFQREVSDGDLLVRLKIFYPINRCEFKKIEDKNFIFCEKIR